MRTRSMQLGPQERLLLLKTLSGGDRLAVQALVPLAELAIERQYRRGAVVIDAGAPLNSVYVVATGRLRMAREGDPDAVIGPGEVAGILEVLAGLPAPSTIAADLDTMLLELPLRTLLEVYEDHFNVYVETLRGLAEGLVAFTPAANRRHADFAWHGGFDRDNFADRLTVLRLSPVFQHCRLDSLARIAAELEPFTAAPGEPLWKRGEASTWVGFLVEGEIAGTLDSGRTFVESAGAYIGSAEAFARAPRSYAASAAVSIVGLRLGIEAFIDILEDDFALARNVMGEFARAVLAAATTAEGEHDPTREPDRP